jgi:peptidoglycan hydrolase-like protein with peptidoglycan-binding domain
MGHRGPAFLVYDNFGVFLRWNQSLVYSSTAAYLATRFAGAPAVRLGDPEPGLDRDALIQLQEILTGLGYDVGETDGILGARTRDALRREQLRLGLPADAWPTPALLRALGEG